MRWELEREYTIIHSIKQPKRECGSECFPPHVGCRVWLDSAKVDGAAQEKVQLFQLPMIQSGEELK